MKKPSDDLPPPETIWLTLEDFEYLCFDLARKLMAYNEPIPDYETRVDALLASALGSPQQTFDQKLLYPTLAKQAAVLFYSLIKNHPFGNGNKRIAVMSLLVFLSLNRKWINLKPFDLYELAFIVSESKPTKRTILLSQIEEIIENTLVEFPKL